MAIDLVTLQEYKEYKGLKNPDDDPRRIALISSVSKLVETYCDRVFKDYVDTPAVEMHSALNTEVYLYNFPVIDVVSVETSEDGGFTYVALTEMSSDRDGYIVDKEEGVIHTQKHNVPFLWSAEKAINSLRITYTAGYADLPLDLKLAVFDLVHYYESEEQVPSKSLMSGNIDNPMPYMSLNFPAHISRILNMYRAPMGYRD